MFRRPFTRVVRQCQAAGLVSAETMQIDASLIRANVSMDALVARHLTAVEDANDAEQDARTGRKFKKLCRTDPDATMAMSSKAPLRPAYTQHTAVDGSASGRHRSEADAGRGRRGGPRDRHGRGT